MNRDDYRNYRFLYRLSYQLPEHLLAAEKIATRNPVTQRFRPENIVIAGMGGSGIGGDILRAVVEAEAVQSKSLPPIIVHKDYEPSFLLGPRTLFFAVSFSGNTEETISAYHYAQRRRAAITVITSGGKLAELARRHGDRLIMITAPAGCPPRAAIAYLFLPLADTLFQLRLYPGFRRHLAETVYLLTNRRRAYRRAALRLAEELNGRVPLIYSTSRLLTPAALRWCCQLNENAKIFAHMNEFPELNHNEIVGIGGPAEFARSCYIVILMDSGVHPRVGLRVRFTSRLLQTACAGIRQLRSEGKSPLARVLSMVMYGDLVSCYLARKRNVDPLPVTRIDRLKSLMAGE